MDVEGVMAWVAEYERGWRENDPAAPARLFTEDARYRKSPYEPDAVGHEGIGAFWTEDDGLSFRMTAEPVAVQGDRAVVRVEVQYLGDGDQQYRDLWVLRFGPDGRVADFEEWAYWPGLHYTPSAPAV